MKHVTMDKRTYKVLTKFKREQSSLLNLEGTAGMLPSTNGTRRGTKAREHGDEGKV